MHQYLVDHAIKNVWSSPRQDGQLVLAPKRISPPRGCLNLALVMENNIPLPEKRRHFHIFHLGQADPNTINLLRLKPHWRTQRWFKFSEAINVNKLEITIYNAEGVNLPRNDCYYLFTDEKTIIFAVPENNRRFQKSFINYREQIYFRIYKNHFFSLAHQTDHFVKTGFSTPQNSEEILIVERELKAKDNTGVQLKTYVNGLILDKPNFTQIQFDDYVEWVHDTSIKRLHEWKLSSLHQFRSELDNTYKYLLHFEGSSERTIDFQDDLDVYVIYRPQGQAGRGVYYNRNLIQNHRMVTHRDYSISTSVVMTLKDALADKLDLGSISNEDIYIRLYVREGGTRRNLVLEHNRLFELYKLSDQNRYRALIGQDALVPEWYCVNLEKSAYTQLMREKAQNVNLNLVEEAYGYNACSVLLANTPQLLNNDAGFLRTFLPYGLTQNSTVYEFDGEGLLLGYRWHNNDDSYEPTNEECAFIEAVIGKPGQTLDCVYGQDLIPLPDSNFSYRVYLCYLVGGEPNENWVDITDDNTYYEIIDGKLNWKLGGTDHWLMIRGDKNILTLDFDLQENDGLLNFSLLENPTGNPVDELVPMSIPLAQLDIWLNRHKLIRGIDYYVKFPQVFITNKTLLKQPVESSLQRLHVRMMRLPEKEMQLDRIEETGWILNGSLSNNHIYDIRDDKVLQINVGGKLYLKDQLTFGEDRPGQSILNIMNGLPYQIKDIIVPMKGLTQTDTYKLRKKSMELDQRVSAYMTEKFGSMDNHEFSAITSRYPVVSPFMSHILFLLKNRLIQLPEERLLSDQEVRNICKIHEKLLVFDPLFELNRPDENFSYIVPHANHEPYSLDFHSYRFMQAVVRLYGLGKVSINDYVNINS